MGQRSILRLALVVPILLALLVVPAAASGKERTATFVKSSDPHTSWGEPVTFTAFVKADHEATGSVQFTLDGKNVGSTVPLHRGEARATALALPPGVHLIGAQYLGDAKSDPSSAKPIEQVVDGHLHLRKTADRDIVPAGWIIHYTIRVTNDTATGANVEVMDILPANANLVSFDGGGRARAGRVYWRLSLPAGASCDLHVSVGTVTTVRGAVVNRAKATWGPFSVSTSNLVTVIAP